MLAPGDFTLGELHHVIQAAMGWEDCHLHEFEVGLVRYGPEEEDDDIFGLDVEDEDRVTLGVVAPKVGAKLRYVYDFGDGWRHTITVQKIEPAEPGQSYPLAVAGKRATPPEDSGGPYFYEQLLEALRDPAHPDPEDTAEWAGSFDPEHFDLEGVNARLSRLRRRRRGQRAISAEAGMEADTREALLSLKVPKALRETAGRVMALTDTFIAQHLDADYLPIARRAAASLARNRPSPLLNGTVESWAGVVLSLVMVFNAMLETPEQPDLWMTRIGEFVGLPPNELMRQTGDLLPVLNFLPYDVVLPRYQEEFVSFFEWVEEIRDGYSGSDTLPPHLQRFAPFLDSPAAQASRAGGATRGGRGSGPAAPDFARQLPSQGRLARPIRRVPP